ncbi:hypothetical protein [Halomonas lysinitropha]|uniref:Uncharacterized protein n=1 Tax=Halomonas lysinitropha TaxID=2607506 RepID=A0A5K1I8X8_9GAMM|nr:hypothetical protein [Halomonas lysinitropha]VVZ96518.1 hypothetical protein HALO32_02619 [Halomonas lysinitropha]
MAQYHLQFGPAGYVSPTGGAPLQFGVAQAPPDEGGGEPTPGICPEWHAPVGTVPLQFGFPAEALAASVSLQFGICPEGEPAEPGERFPASLTATLPAPTAELAATVPVAAGAIAATLPAPEATAQARALLRPAINASLAPPTATITAEQRRPVGTLFGVLPPPTAGLTARALLRPVIDVTLAAPQATATATLRVRAQVAASLPAPQAWFEAERDINVWRGPGVQAATDYQQGEAVPAHVTGRYAQSERYHQATATRYQQADPLSRGTHATAQHLPRLDEMRRIVQEHGERLASQRATHNRYLPRLDRHRTPREQQGAAIWQHAGTHNRWLPHLRTQWGLPYQQASRILACHWGSDWQTAAPHPLAWQARYEQAKWPDPGTSPYPHPPVEPPPDPYVPDNELPFCRPGQGDTDLGFGPIVCHPVGVPIRRTYLVSNTASLKLVATGQLLDASAISAAIDADSWSWEMRATVHGQASLDAVRNASQPVEIEAVLNGYVWRGVLDSWSRQRQFGEVPTITLSARSLAAYLAAPHAEPRSYSETQTRTARQLATQELPLGWTLDWQIDDWLVEPEAWHYTNRTPIEAITAIANAAGAMVQAHRSAPQLIIAPRYALPHWAWAGTTPSVTLPLDVLTRLGSELRRSEALNGVYISGETTGVLALVKRTGTAADRLGEMVVDPLITRQAPARARGISVLSASGAQTRESLALPLADDLAGLLETGQLLHVDPSGDDWRGLVRAVSLNARLQNDALTIEQTAELERHLEETA